MLLVGWRQDDEVVEVSEADRTSFLVLSRLMRLGT